jgi:hypothetical protein
MEASNTNKQTTNNEKIGYLELKARKKDSGIKAVKLQQHKLVSFI